MGVMGNFYFANYPIVVPDNLFANHSSRHRFLQTIVLDKSLHVDTIDILENLFVKFANCSSGQLSLQFIQIVVLDDLICKFCKLW